jgi:pyruvate,water dikinase
MEEGWIVDSAPSRRYPIYTRANVGEVFPEPVAPLTATIGIDACAEPGWRDALERFGAFTSDEFDPANNEIVGVFGGYCYLNVSVSRILGVRTPGLTPEQVDWSLWGEQPGVPPYEPTPTDERSECTTKVQETLQWILTTPDIDELKREESFLADLKADRPDLTSLSDAELVTRNRGLLGGHMRRLFAQHLFVTYASTVPVGIVQQVCTQLGHPELALTLIAGVGDVESAAPSYALWELGRQVATSSALTRAFDAGVDGLLGRLRASAATDADATRFLDGWAAFVDAYGSRGPNEWEVRSPTWETDPTLALSAIDRMRLSPESAAPRGHNDAMAREREQLAPQIVAKVDGHPETQGQLQAALHAATVFLAGRERSKTNAIKLTHEARLGFMELGRRMVDAGHFESPLNFGMLRDQELDDFLADPTGWSSEVARREERYGELGRIEPPFVFVGDPPPTSTWARRDARPVAVAGSGDVLPGIPGCPGRARGRARVVLDSHDPSALEPGDVLVAPITDPSWTPLFVPAAAVVVDVGAPLSHAIIVSRELGIPCVVSVTDGTRRILDGAMLEVDGTTGTVTVL